MNKSMKRLAGTQADTATPPKRSKTSSTAPEIKNSADSESEKSDSEELNLPAAKGNTPSAGSADKDDELLNEIAQGFESYEKTDPKVTQKLADIVNKRWASELDETKLKDKLTKYNRPDNCEKLTVPKVNPEIWNKLKHGTRSADLRLANMQKTLVKVGTALSKSTDTLLAIRASPDKFPGAVLSERLGELVTYNADAPALLGHVHAGMSYRRRDIIKPNLNMEYSASCGSQVPITGFLFGDELQPQLNNIKASNKLVSPW